MENQELKQTIETNEKTNGCNLYTPFELFGIECDKGWYPLVKKAIAAIARYNGINQCNSEFGPVEFVQIKEKHGELCLYLNYYPTQYLKDEIRQIEMESVQYCEHCGTTENVKTRDIRGWTYTYCDKCTEKEIKRFNKLYGSNIS